MILNTKDFNWWSSPRSGQVTQMPEKTKNQMWDKPLSAARPPQTDTTHQHGHRSQGLMCPHERAALTSGLGVTNLHVQLQLSIFHLSLEHAQALLSPGAEIWALLFALHKFRENTSSVNTVPWGCWGQRGIAPGGISLAPGDAEREMQVYKSA